MDDVQDLLFGQSPRRVGTPEQHWTFSKDQVDFFIRSIDGRRNAYGTAGWWDFVESGEKVCDKVLYDFDGDKDAFESDTPDDERIALMRDDPDLAEDVLGQVVDDVRELAEGSISDNVPIIGVFSGFGIHVHQLFQARRSPSTAMATTAYRYLDTLNLQTADHAVIGQPERLCRIPNCERVTSPGPQGVVTDGRGCGLYTIPFRGSELAEITVEELMAQSQSKRSLSPSDAAERPEMRIWDDYKTGVEEDADVPPRPLNPEETDFGDDSFIRWLLEELVRMPCMVERMLDDPNPDHEVRLNTTVLLFNVGLDPNEVMEIYRQIGWVDFDADTTRKHVESIWRKGYADMSCETLRGKGLCVRSDDPQSCGCFGWSGGKPEWKQ
jgi:hypothetical protein